MGLRRSTWYFQWWTWTWTQSCATSRLHQLSSSESSEDDTMEIQGWRGEISSWILMQSQVRFIYQLLHVLFYEHGLVFIFALCVNSQPVRLWQTRTGRFSKGSKLVQVNSLDWVVEQTISGFQVVQHFHNMPWPPLDPYLKGIYHDHLKSLKECCNWQIETFTGWTLQKPQEVLSFQFNWD